MKKPDIIDVILCFVILCIGLYLIASYFEADADDSKDYSWVSRIAEERDENNLKLAEKTKQRDELSKEIEYLQDRNKTITCKLNIGDRDATCEQGLN